MSNIQDIAETHSERALVLLDYLDGEVVSASPDEVKRNADRIAAAVTMLREEIEAIHARVHGKEDS